MNLYKELEELKFELGIIKKVYCSKAEEEKLKQLKKANQPLPEDIEEDNISNSYFRYIETDMSKEEIKELLLYRQTKYLSTIKNSLIFIAILTVLSFALSFLIG